MFEKILVPLDGSTLAEAALPVARELQEKFGSEIVLVRAITSVAHHMASQAGLYETPSGAAAGVELISQMVEEERKEATEYLRSVEARVSSQRRADIVVEEGDAAHLLIETANQKGAGVIVMSSHGRGGLGRLVFGSVADAVLRESHIPVLLIRSQEAHA